jgi:hypothetical protein
LLQVSRVDRGECGRAGGADSVKSRLAGFATTASADRMAYFDTRSAAVRAVLG